MTIWIIIVASDIGFVCWYFCLLVLLFIVCTGLVTLPMDYVPEVTFSPVAN